MEVSSENKALDLFTSPTVLIDSGEGSPYCCKIFIAILTVMQK